MMSRLLLVPFVILAALQISMAQQKPSAALAPIHSRADLTQAISQIEDDLAALDKSHEAVQAAAEKLANLYAKLASKGEGIGKAAASINPTNTGCGGVNALLDATRQMQETQMSFNLQYLQLQSQLQNENRSYTAVSNILKTKHDTVKNAINNIR